MSRRSTTWLFIITLGLFPLNSFGQQDNCYHFRSHHHHTLIKREMNRENKEIVLDQNQPLKPGIEFEKKVKMKEGYQYWIYMTMPSQVDTASLSITGLLHDTLARALPYYENPGNGLLLNFKPKATDEYFLRYSIFDRKPLTRCTYLLIVREKIDQNF